MFINKKNISFLLLLAFLPLFGQSRSIAELSGSPAAIAYGGIGSLPHVPIEGSAVQPAYLADFERNGGSLGFISGDDLVGGYGLFFISSGYGTLGLGVEGYKDSIKGAGDTFVTLKMGYGRKITDSFGFGLYLFPAFIQNNLGTRVGLGISPGLTYSLYPNWEIINGLGLHDLRFSLLGRNFAIYSGKGSRPKMTINTGVHSILFKKMGWQFKYGSEISVAESENDIRLHQGVSIDYKWFSLRLGYIHSDQIHFQGFTSGIGLDIPISEGNLVFNYAYLPKSNDRSDYHFISGGGSFGYIDREPPEVDLKLESLYFSPNVDGNKDNNHFTLKVSDYSPIKKWKLIVRNSQGKVIRIFENSKRDFTRSFSISSFLGQFFFAKDGLQVPNKIRWDGTSERVDLAKTALKNNSKKNSLALPDGDYFYSFTAVDERNNQSQPIRGKIVLDNTSPEIRVAMDKAIFSPNGDGNLDTLQIFHESKADPRDFWIASIQDSDGNKVKNYSWKGQSIPAEIKWDGTDNKGENLPEGIYHYVIYGEDPAGNRTNAKSKAIALTRKVDVVYLQPQGEGFSPNQDGVQDEIILKTGFPNRNGIQSWSLNVYEGEPDPDNIVRSWSGSGQSIPESILWGGKSDSNKILDDSEYNILLSAQYKTGNSPKSFVRKVVIDKSPPKIEIDSKLDIFSPDGDGENETQAFSFDISDESSITDYKFEIFEVQYNDKNRRSPRLFKTFSGKEWPKQILWDGKSDLGNIVESATVYEYKLTAKDRFGNIGVSNIGQFETDILVLVTDRGLKVRLSNIEFALGKARLRKKSKKLLKKLARLLNRYPNYKIKVEGHSDDIGGEDLNLRLSELRAKSVMAYLISSGIDEEKISFQGLGETQPMLPNSNWYNRSRNRRVEFILIKSNK